MVGKRANERVFVKNRTETMTPLRGRVASVNKDIRAARVAAARLERDLIGPVAGSRVRAMQDEKKTLDTAIAMNFDSNSAVASCMTNLTVIPNGNTGITRMGKSVNLRAVAIRGQIEAASATVEEKVSLLLVLIKTPNAATTLPAVNEILLTQSANALTNRDNASKFRILRRWDYTVIGNSTTPATESTLFDIEEYVDLKGVEALYQQGTTSGAIGSQIKGCLILLAVGTKANGATTTPTMVGNARLYFSDPS